MANAKQSRPQNPSGEVSAEPPQEIRIQPDSLWVVDGSAAAWSARVVAKTGERLKISFQSKVK
jgi:hypothetical protein